MANLAKGWAAGFVATVVLSILMAMKSMMGLMPGLDMGKMLGDMMAAGATAGWIVHFVIGTFVWGMVFVLIEPYLPGGALWAKGVVFGLLAWLLMMAMIMPVAGQGLFALELGMAAPAMTAMLHAIFGAVLGETYALLSPWRRGEHAHV